MNQPKEWDLLAIELRQEYWTKRWYYKVNFVKNIKTSFPPQFGIYILMDGTMVEPVPDKECANKALQRDAEYRAPEH